MERFSVAISLTPTTSSSSHPISATGVRPRPLGSAHLLLSSAGSRFHYTHHNKGDGPIHSSIEILDRDVSCSVVHLLQQGILSRV